MHVVPQEESIPAGPFGGHGELHERVDIAKRSDRREVQPVPHIGGGYYDFGVAYAMRHSNISAVAAPGGV